MPYFVTIRRVSDGKEAVYRSEGGPAWDPGDEGYDFLWSEGNYSCDCNRHLFFERASGNLGENEFSGDTCSDGKYVVTKIVDEAGRLLYSEVIETP